MTLKVEKDKEDNTMKILEIASGADLGCDICETKGPEAAEVAWFGAKSNWAHQICFDKIAPAENLLYQTIDVIFKNQMSKNQAHQLAIKNIKQNLGAESIMSYLLRTDIDSLTKLFHSYGVQAVISNNLPEPYASSLHSELDKI